MLPKMQFTINNGSSNSLCVFHSNRNYTDSQLVKMIRPDDLLQKMAFDYYWYKKQNDDLANYLINQLNPYVQYYGTALPGADVQVFNVNRVPEYLYVFFPVLVNNTAQLWYYQISSKTYFSQFDTFSVYQYTISITDQAETPVIVSENDETQGLLYITYTGTPIQLSFQKLAWQPEVNLNGTNHIAWQAPLLVFLFVIFIMIAIVITFAVAMKTINTSTYHITKNIEHPVKYEPQILT